MDMRHFLARTALGAGTLALGLGLGACGGEGDDPARFDPEYTAGTSAALSRASSCDDLTDRLRYDALVRVEEQTQRLLDEYVREGGWYADRFGGEADAGAPSADDGAGGREAAPDDFSETNNQVEGVDEADLVKTDGLRIFVVSGNAFHVVKSWPADETSLRASVPIEGYAYEMLIEGDRAVVFSTTGDPRTSPEDYCRGYDAWYPCYGGWGFTKMTVVDITDDGPVLAKELWVEGSYRSARKHSHEDGATVRAVFNDYRSLPWYDGSVPYPYEFLWPDEECRYWYGGCEPPTRAEMRRRILAWRAAAIEAIFARTLDQWLPVTLEPDGAGGYRSLPPDCERFHLPEPGLATWGIVQIVGLELGDLDAPVQRTGIWGWAREIYANHDVMVLVQDDYSTWWRARREPGEVVSNRTFVHQFGLGDGGRTDYQASGLVPGGIVDQFSLDERDGVLRIATTETRWSWDPEEWTPPETDSRVYALSRDGDELRVRGATERLAPGERIFSVRYLGDLAYVVTFRQVDPLFAIDTSDPEELKVLGELKIPGFSTYMHPLGDDHLLTIGQDADETTGRVTGLALQIFDVSNPSAPRQAHKYVFEDRWGYSEALWEHKAFTYFPPKPEDGRLVGQLAFPYVAWGSDWDDYRSSLELFDVDVTSGIAPRGSIDHTNLLGDLCDGAEDWSCRYYGMPIRRGVFIEDYLYSISWGGVRVHDTRDLSDVAELRFPRD